MPFMIGKAPTRRTLEFLKKGRIILRESVKVFSINYNTKGDHNSGAKDFVFWYLPQIQYKNPNVQCICFKNLTPSPFIRIFFEDGKSTIIDIDCRKKEEVLRHLVSFAAVCKTREEILKESTVFTRLSDKAYFGYGCERHCMCEILGQIPCSSIIPVPKIWRGIPEKKPKYRVPPHYLHLSLDYMNK